MKHNPEPSHETRLKKLLGRSELYFAHMVSAVEDYAIFALDPDGYVITWNEGAARIKQYSASEIIGHHMSLFYTPTDQSTKHFEKELEVASRKGTYREQGWRVRKDGSIFWADVTITAIKDADGLLMGFTKVTRDLSERKSAEERLRISEGNFKAVVSAVKDYAIFLLDVNGYILTWNEGGQRIKGYTAPEIIGKHFSVFYREEDRQDNVLEEELKQAEENGHLQLEGWRLRKDGSTFWASVTLTPVLDEAGILRGFLKVTRDLTDQKLHEENLRAARNEAMRSNVLKSQFVANVSHEIRTPMSGIIGMAELLNIDPGLGDEQRELAEYLLDSSKKLLLVLNDLLDFSKLEAGRVQLDAVDFSISSLLLHINQSLDALAASKGIGITFDMEHSLSGRFQGDEVKIRQVLLNLTNNALKFTHEGSIKVAANVVNDSDTSHIEGRGVTVRFSVQDTGIGIPEDQKSKLFEPFIQADGSTRRLYGGTGLGLSICRGFVQVMGGQIGFESDEGVGSTFWFIIPLQRLAKD